MTDGRGLGSTYRLQLHAGFTFADAAATVPYLARLGVTHLYLSPILQAAPRSQHGYDVVDHSCVSNQLGGRPGLLALAAYAHEHELGVIVDVVPNHMAVPTPEYLNRQLWDLLRLGRDAPSAHWFDVDWEFGGGRIGLPVLGAPLADVLAAGDLAIGRYDGEPTLEYFKHRFPIAPGSDLGAPLDALLAAQHYTLASWRDKDDVLNYRRFFDVDSLIAIRVELDDVFDATHAVLLELFREGAIDGFRIDHPDGLADPQAYLERLHDATGGAWIVVEKILAPGEELPLAWPCSGTTGYDAMRVIQAALVPPVAPELDERWRATGGEPSLELVEIEAKGLVVRNLFEPEVRRLARLAVAASGGALALDVCEEGLRELLSHVEVYRAYLRPGEPAPPEEVARLDRLLALAERSRPDLADTLAALRLLLGDTEAATAAGRDLVIRFQQVCGPVMAKGIEDTTFYRWHRLIALDEVGGDPRSLDAPDAELMHDLGARAGRALPAGSDDALDARHEAQRGRAGAPARRRRGHRRLGRLLGGGAPACGRVPRRRADRLPPLPDAARRLAARARPAHRLHGEGDQRVEAVHELERPERALRGARERLRGTLPRRRHRADVRAGARGQRGHRSAPPRSGASCCS